MDFDVTRIAEYELATAVESMTQAQTKEDLDIHYGDAIALLDSVYDACSVKFEYNE